MDNDRKRLCTLRGTVLVLMVMYVILVHPGEVDCSYVLCEYILRSIHILYEYTLYCTYSTLYGYIQKNVKGD